jgi:hypothetical protein
MSARHGNAKVVHSFREKGDDLRAAARQRYLAPKALKVMMVRVS